MKKVILLFCAIAGMALLAACQKEPQKPVAPAAPVLWTSSDTPSRVEYRRLWEYSAQGETEDPAQIREIVEAVKALTVGEEDPSATDDFTDVLVFSFAQGEPLQLEFENQSWVTPEGTRFHVEGLARLRAALDPLIAETE